MTWRESALCAQVDPELFFPEKGVSAVPAKRICMGCEVRLPCLEFALRTGQTYGVWGGFNERERRDLRRLRARLAS